MLVCESFKGIPLFTVLSIFICSCFPWQFGFGGLVMHYKLDETSGTTVTDSSGNGYDGTLLNFTSPGWESGQVGGSLRFSGGSPSERVQITGVPDLGQQVTYAAWYSRSAAANSYNSLFHRSGGGGQFWIADLTTGNDFRAYTTSGAANGFLSYASFSPTVEEWNHIAVTYDNTLVKLYLNGSMVKSHTVDVPLSSSTDSIRWGTFGGIYELQGRLDDVRVYDHVLSASEVSALALSSAPEPALVFASFGMLTAFGLGFREWRARRKAKAT
tara:strand:- start:168 stop:980 length:813 start_codon:yes stop_codon:yes gene_type:complete